MTTMSTREARDNNNSSKNNNNHGNVYGAIIMTKVTARDVCFCAPDADCTALVRPIFRQSVLLNFNIVNFPFLNPEDNR